MFIWSNEGIFGDDEKARRDSADEEPDDDPDDDDADDVRDLGGATESGYDHPVFGKSWAYNAASIPPNDDDNDTRANRSADAAKSASTDGARRLLTALARFTKGPDDIDAIRARTSEDAADAFRRIVMGIFGTVPGDSFEIIVNTDQSGVSRLMQSALATGYALRNAEWRMTFSDALAPTASAPAPPDTAPSGGTPVSGEPDYMRSVPRRSSVRTTDVAGAVQWWDAEREERREMSAREYVSKLESENELLRERLNATRIHGSNANKILDYMRTVSPEKIAALQQGMSADALDAFKATIKNILGEFTPDKVQISYSTSRDYLGQLSFWCLLVGYHVRNLEKKFEMSRMLDLAEPLPTSSSEKET